MLGVKPGDRVALVSPNRPEWHIVDFAVQGIGGVNVPLYFNESPDRMVYIINDSGAKIVIVAGDEQARRLSSCRDRLTSVEHIIAVSSPAGLTGEILSYETLIATSSGADIADYRATAAAVTADQLATIIYTSGTTGEPKGVMLTHSNLASNALDGLGEDDIQSGDIGLSFLPLAHVYERTVDYGYIFRGVSVAYVERIEDVPQALLEVHPTIVAAVPRFFEKIYANIFQKARRETGIKRSIFEWGMQVATAATPWRAYRRPVSAWTKLQWEMANKLVYSKIRAGLGGRVRIFSSGGAPLAVELAEFYAAIDVNIFQGYGLTETSPVVSANTRKANKVGTVGRPIPHVEVKIAEDGEILVRGACVMQGYYRKPDQTREVFHRGRLVAHGGYWPPGRRWLLGRDRSQEGTAENCRREICGAAADRESVEGQPVRCERDRRGRSPQVCQRALRAEFRCACREGARVELCIAGARAACRRSLGACAFCGGIGAPDREPRAI